MVKIKNRIRKLLTLSKKEIIFRIIEIFNEKKDYLLYFCGVGMVRTRVKVSSQKKNLFFTEACNREKRKELILKIFDSKKIIHDAEKILSSQVTLLGQIMSVPSGEGWHIDPVTKKKWPYVFYAKVRHHQSVSDMDIKFVWEINRHQYLVPLAKAFWLQGDEKYAKKVFSVICDWISSNPYNTGVNWASSLEHAVRLFSWIWALYLCRDSLFYDKNMEKIKQSIYEQTCYISRHLSFYSSPYNHLVGEAAALNIVGALFSEFKEADTWEKIGWQILESNIEKQFHPDGMSVEQAFFYHHFTLGFYLQSIFLRRINGKNISDSVLNRVEKAIEISMFLSKPDKTIPMTGDIDNARSIYFSPEHSWNFFGFCGLGAVLFNRPDFKHQGQNIPEELLWMLDDTDLKRFISMESELPADSLRVFEKSGYCVIRDSWDKNSHYLCFDCGEIAHGLSDAAIPSAAHGHADGLAFELSAFGKSFIVDSGFFTYFGNLEWHKHFRHEEAHNTVHLKGYRQAEYCGRLKWQNVKKPKFLEWKQNNNFFSCSAMIQYDSSVSHTREVYYQKNDLWIIKDTVKTGDKAVPAKTYLHFHPDVDITMDHQAMEITAKRGEIQLLIRLLGKAGIDKTKGGAEPCSGWVCQGYGIKEEAWQVVISWDPKANNYILPFLIIPYKEDSDNFDLFYNKDSQLLDFIKNGVKKSFSIKPDMPVCIAEAEQ